MKRVFSLMVLLALMATGANAQLESYIGLFADEDATICNADVEVYAYTTFHIIAYLEPGEMALDSPGSNPPGPPSRLAAWPETRLR